MFDLSLISSLASHLGYWNDEDVAHFMISQLLARRGYKVSKRSRGNTDPSGSVGAGAGVSGSGGSTPQRKQNLNQGQNSNPIITESPPKEPMMPPPAAVAAVPIGRKKEGSSSGGVVSGGIFGSWGGSGKS